MYAVVLVIHCMIAVALIGVVLIQKSEGGGLGIGGGGMSGFMTGRSQANLLTRTTAILAFAITVTSVSLSILSVRTHGPTSSVLDRAAPAAVPATAPQPAENKTETPAAAAPASPEQPAPPLPK
jgi:preprotein translocase subunit SecG